MINKAIRMNTTQRFKDARKALADAQERASSLRHLETANACQQGIDRITELEAENKRLRSERDNLLRQREQRIYNADLQTIADMGYPATVNRISRHITELEGELQSEVDSRLQAWRENGELRRENERLRSDISDALSLSRQLMDFGDIENVLEAALEGKDENPR